MASNKDIKIDVNIKDQVKVFRDSFDKHKNDISDGFESAEIERKLDRIEKLLSKSSLTHKEMSSIEKLASSLRASLSKVVSNSAPQKLKDLEEKRIEAEEKREKASKIIARSPVTLKSIREGKFKASSELGKIGGASRFYAMMNDENLGDDWKTLADGRRLTDDSEGRKFFARITKNYENFDVFGKYKDLVEAKFRSYDKGGSGYFEMQRNVHKALKDYTEANASIADYNKQYEELGKKEKNSEDLINEVKELNAAADKILDEISNKKDEQKEEEIKQDPSIKLQDKKTGNGLNTAIKKFAVYGVALKAIKAALREAVNTVKELDKSLTEQAMVTGLTRKQTYALIGSYQDLALETGATTKEIAEVSTEYMKQGKTVAEAQILTKAAVSAAKVARVSVGDSVNYLTTALNGFRLSADQAMLVSDKFAAVAAASATDYDELAIALSKVASQANLAGMSIDYTTALLTKGLETTREAPETMGTALKTIIARMRELTDYGKTLEDGISLNNVETQLQYVGIELRNQQGELRSTEDVLDELGKKWSALNANQQAALAKALAGTRWRMRLWRVQGSALKNYPSKSPWIVGTTLKTSLLTINGNI